jgi:Kef-type K+ transport system membrane component KefB
MVLLFAAVPVFARGDGEELGAALGSAALWLGLKALAFAAGCLLFARYFERPMTHFFRRLTEMPDPVIVMAAAGLAIAALAGLFGFSLAIGALLAGLLFSRDPEAVRMEPSFRMLYDLFTPFFFIGVGLLIDPGVLGEGLLAGGLLLLPAIVGKMVGAGAPALLEIGWRGAVLIGASMVPRAEIAMIVASQGRRMGDWAMPPVIFAGLMTVTLATALLTPSVVRLLLVRWPQSEGGGAHS